MNQGRRDFLKAALATLLVPRLPFTLPQPSKILLPPGVTYVPSQKPYLLEFFTWETTGATLGHLGGFADKDFA